MKQRVIDRINTKFHHQGRDEEGSILSDYVYHYIVNKKSNAPVDMKALITVIVAYIQTHDVYFKYTPQFVEGVIIFGVIGYKKDHTELQNTLCETLSELNCNLQFQEGEELPNEEMIKEVKRK